MEGSVWQLIAQVAAYLSNLFASSSATPPPASGGVSPNVPVSVAPSTSPSTSATILAVIRDQGLQTSVRSGVLTYKGTFF